ncbi:MAG: hypothetical protein WCO13_00700 [Bacteroidota bacterium]
MQTGYAARQRAIFNLAKKENTGSAPAPSYLRVEAVLNSTTNKYDFRFNRTGTEAATERKLDRNDRFIMSEIAVLLSAQDSATIGKEVLQSYPNPLVFTGNTAADAVVLEHIYSGSTSLKISNRVELEAFPNIFFRNVPSTQQKAGIASIETAVALSQINIKEVMYELGALINLDGADDATLSVEFPKFTGTALTPGGTISYKLVFFATGYLIKNGSANK